MAKNTNPASAGTEGGAKDNIATDASFTKIADQDQGALNLSSSVSTTAANGVDSTVGGPSREDVELQFATEIAAKDFGEHHIPSDGEWHHFAFPDNKPGKKSGSAKLNYGGCIEGVVIDRRKGNSPIFTWEPANGATANFTDEVRRAIKAEAENKAATKMSKKEAARLAAVKLYCELPTATPDHPYLVKKGITNVRVLKIDKDTLVVPIYNALTDEFQAIQRILPDGTKRFPKDAVKIGGYAMLGSASTLGAAAKHKSVSPIVVCEGYATADAIYTATFHWVVAALDCGNIKNVVDALRKRFPLRQIIIAADNDEKTEGNPGVTKALEAANIGGIKVAIPPSGDFCDLLLAEGEAALRTLIDESEIPSRGDKVGSHVKRDHAF